ncbi:MAG TPA: choice-of-anchor Q domain-containing protein [Chloroflexota bacterium]|nr:choice-of-anchor Q domain-containing protein [Chloroflexota bacterium]
MLPQAQPTSYPLTVIKTGDGAASGTVTSDPGGISCGANCAYDFPIGQAVTLTASAGSGAVFSGWAGAGCAGTGTCSVVMSAPVSVTAAFTSTIPTATVLYVAGGGSDTGNCSTAGSPCGSVTYALTQAGPGATIHVAAGIHNESVVVEKSVSIVGAGPGNPLNGACVSCTVLQPLGGTGRVFDVTSPTAMVLLSDMTIQGGNVSSGGGAGVRSSATSGGVTLVNAWVRQNTASGDGGGLSGANFTLNNVKLMTNTSSGGRGGGMFATHNLTLTNTSIGENTSQLEGGGVYYDGSPGAGTGAFTGITVASNTVLTQGSGGVHVGAGMSVTFTNSTISGNAVSCPPSNCNYLPGGSQIANVGTTTLLNTTVAGNSAATTSTTVFSAGGTLSLRNTILLKGGEASNCSSTSFQSLGNNLSSDSSCALSGTGDLNSTDPRLGPLGHYGGLTSTHALLSGSPAIDAGSGCPATDQRGTSRPQGSACDIGAYEVVPGAGPTVLSVQRHATQAEYTNQLPVLFTVQFSEPVGGTYTAEDVRLAWTGPGAVGAPYASVSQAGATSDTFSVSVDGVAGYGALTLGVPAGVVTGTANGGPNTAAPASATVYVDFELPQVTIIGPEETQLGIASLRTSRTGTVRGIGPALVSYSAYAGAGPVTLTVQVVDYGSGLGAVPAMALSVYGGGPVAAPSGTCAGAYLPGVATCTYVYQVAPGANDEIIVNASAVDRAGNSGNAYQFSLIEDTTSPDAGVTSISEGQVFGSTFSAGICEISSDAGCVDTVGGLVSGNATDMLGPQVSGLSSVDLRLTRTISGVTTYWSWNAATSSGAFGSDSTSTLPVDLWYGPGSWQSGWETRALPKANQWLEGTYSLRVTARDMVGNVQPTPASTTFYVDVTPPTVTAVTVSEVVPGDYSQLLVTVTAMDALTEIEGIWVELDRVDPALGREWYASGSLISGSCTPDPEFMNTVYSIPAGVPVTCAFTFSLTWPPPNGQYVLVVETADSVNDGETDATFGFAVDTSPPMVKTIQPSGGYVNTTTVPFTVVFDEPVSGLDASDITLYHWSGTPWGTGANVPHVLSVTPGVSTVTTTWTVTVAGLDYVGTSGLSIGVAAGAAQYGGSVPSVEYVYGGHSAPAYDGDAPWTTFYAPPDPGYVFGPDDPVGGNWGVNGSAYDTTSGVASVRVELKRARADGVTYWSETTDPATGIATKQFMAGQTTIELAVNSGPYPDQGSWDITYVGVPWMDGPATYTVTVQAVDYAGNMQATPDTRTFYVDVTPPTITSFSVSPTLAGPGTNVYFAVTATDARPGVDDLRTWFEMGSWSVSSGDTPASYFSDASYTVTAHVYDLVGNEATATATLVIDTTGPAAVSFSHAYGGPTSASPLVFTLEFNETVANLSTGCLAAVDQYATPIPGASVLSVTPVGSAPATTWTVLVGGVSTPSLVGLRLDSLVVADVAGNLNPNSALSDLVTFVP